MKKLSDPSVAFLSTLMSLYLTGEVHPYSGVKEAENLPPKEALVLGLMCLNRTYNSAAFSNALFNRYRVFDSRECDIITETGMLNLKNLGFIKPASKAAQKALDERNDRVWGLGDVPFVVTAKGAKRIGYVVANLRGGLYKDVVKELQAESKAAAKDWSA